MEGGWVCKKLRKGTGLPPLLLETGLAGLEFTVKDKLASDLCNLTASRSKCQNYVGMDHHAQKPRTLLRGFENVTLKVRRPGQLSIRLRGPPQPSRSSFIPDDHGPEPSCLPQLHTSGEQPEAARHDLEERTSADTGPDCTCAVWTLRAVPRI